MTTSVGFPATSVVSLSNMAKEGLKRIVFLSKGMLSDCMDLWRAKGRGEARGEGGAWKHIFDEGL